MVKRSVKRSRYAQVQTELLTSPNEVLAIRSAIQTVRVEVRFQAKD